MILFILQNAYKSAKHPFTNNQEWSRELLCSHTGRRLKEMIPDNSTYAVINASPLIGDNPDSIYIADTTHILNMIASIKPDVICACGKIAQEGCRKLNLTFIPAPHPAWRCLSKIITTKIRNRLVDTVSIPLQT